MIVKIIFVEIHDVETMCYCSSTCEKHRSKISGNDLRHELFVQNERIMFLEKFGRMSVS
ncbi:hypothetical protein WN51_04068 [Melipona quadrifasciata]|uniref:Uncharacterized protein n=1 Tax=Melipona quadrifasciata TaxID=166423 RepID=A0A0N0U327_9HYME|nr:hypothetical protein WN51_04068 [Melipona quadrifasciata]